MASPARAALLSSFSAAVQHRCSNAQPALPRRGVVGAAGGRLVTPFAGWAPLGMSGWGGSTLGRGFTLRSAALAEDKKAWDGVGMSQEDFMIKVRQSSRLRGCGASLALLARVERWAPGVWAVGDEVGC